jgi:hypothetical protein
VILVSGSSKSDRYPKTPTLNLYLSGDPEHKLAVWGWKAKLESHKHTIDHFKPSEQPISPYLTAFHEYATGEIMRGFANNFQQDHFRYCLTVPAMWSDKAKSLMRKAAIETGIINATDHPDRLMLISEPEAAALFCGQKCDQFDLGHGDQFLICDAGCGTVDLIVFKTTMDSSGQHLSEVTKGHASCGFIFLDRSMHCLMEKKFGHSTATVPADEIKLHFDGLDDQFLQLPAVKCFDNIEDPEGIGIGYMLLTASELKEHVFEPVVKDVLLLIQEQLNHAKFCSAIMAGGFGSSRYLYDRVQAQFGGQVELILTSPCPELAVVEPSVQVLVLEL